MVLRFVEFPSRIPNKIFTTTFFAATNQCQNDKPTQTTEHTTQRLQNVSKTFYAKRYYQSSRKISEFTFSRRTQTYYSKIKIQLVPPTTFFPNNLETLDENNLIDI